MNNNRNTDKSDYLILMHCDKCEFLLADVLYKNFLFIGKSHFHSILRTN